MTSAHGRVLSVSRNEAYSFTKPMRDEITLVAGIGVEGDAHAGVRVRHRGRVRADPTQPNLRQVHLIHRELFAEVGEKGYAVVPGDLGENVTTDGLDLLGLPVGTILRFGPPAGESAAVSIGGEGPAVSIGSVGAVSPSVGAVSPGGEGVAVDPAGWDAASLGGGVAADRDAAASPADGSAAEGPGGGGAAAGSGGVDAANSPAAAVAPLLAAAAATTLDGPTAAAVRAVAAAAERDSGGDPRPAVVVAGLRNPCAQINKFQPGLLKEVIGRDDHGNVVRKGGVMAVVLRGGPVRRGDVVSVELPPSPHAPLDLV